MGRVRSEKKGEEIEREHRRYRIGGLNRGQYIIQVGGRGGKMGHVYEYLNIPLAACSFRGGGCDNVLRFSTRASLISPLSPWKVFRYPILTRAGTARPRQSPPFPNPRLALFVRRERPQRGLPQFSARFNSELLDRGGDAGVGRPNGAGLHEPAGVVRGAQAGAKHFSIK